MKIKDVFKIGNWVRTGTDRPFKITSKRMADSCTKRWFKPSCSAEQRIYDKYAKMREKSIKIENKFYDTKKFGTPKIRVYHKKGRGKYSPQYTLKCGCCDKSITIFYDPPEDLYPTLEIGGILGSVNNWKEILLPLLGVKA